MTRRPPREAQSEVVADLTTFDERKSKVIEFWTGFSLPFPFHQNATWGEKFTIVKIGLYRLEELGLLSSPLRRGELRAWLLSGHANPPGGKGIGGPKSGRRLVGMARPARRSDCQRRSPVILGPNLEISVGMRKTPGETRGLNWPIAERRHASGMGSRPSVTAILPLPAWPPGEGLQSRHHLYRREVGHDKPHMRLGVARLTASASLGFRRRGCLPGLLPWSSTKANLPMEGQRKVSRSHARRLCGQVRGSESPSFPGPGTFVQRRRHGGTWG